MKTFSRLSLFILVCFGFAVMLIGNTADVHAQVPSLEIKGDTGQNKVYEVGASVTTEFFAKIGAAAAPNENITITTHGIGIPSVTGVVKTHPLTGGVEVTGTIQLKSGAYIQAEWKSKQLRARADFNAEEIGISSATIVVNPPDPKSKLQIGDTFTQMISIENRGAKYSTLPLSAWQMDVVFNPLILEVVDVTEGGFLESDGKDAVFFESERRSLGRISVSQARAGQMPNADPALPNIAAPSPAGIALAPGDTGELLTITFRVLAVDEEVLGIHNVRLQSDADEDEDGTPDRMSYSILVRDVAVTTHQSSAKEDVNQDGAVNILDLVMVAGNIGSIPFNPRADVNGDGSVNVLDLIMVYTSDHWAKSVDMNEVAEGNVPSLTAPSASRNVTPTTIQSWIDLARVEDDGSVIFDRGIANLEALLVSQIPNETKLLLNYPNPFNPETWIPYQLAKATDVTVMIHSMNGSLIRMLALGHQAAGIYKSKSQAAYWDGRNELGEHVASGLYFYTLTAGKFSATGKMLVRK